MTSLQRQIEFSVRWMRLAGHLATTQLRLAQALARAAVDTPRLPMHALQAVAGLPPMPLASEAAPHHDAAPGPALPAAAPAAKAPAVSRSAPRAASRRRRAPSRPPAMPRRD